jgi:hypothetical protein
MSSVKLYNQVTIRFVIGELNEEDVVALMNDQQVICKMLLSSEDYRLFDYGEGDAIEVETENGNRQWCSITNLEIIESEVGVILIFTLVKRSAFS